MCNIASRGSHTEVLRSKSRSLKCFKHGLFSHAASDSAVYIMLFFASFFFFSGSLSSFNGLFFIRISLSSPEACAEQVAQIALPYGYPYSHSLHLLGNKQMLSTEILFKVTIE